MEEKNIMFVAGDPSGDEHASHVIKQLHKQSDNIKCFGIGGSLMEKEGFEPILPFEPFNRMGLVEVISHLGFFLNAKKIILKEMICRKTSILVCVDYPGLNMELMKKAVKLNIPVVWYIAPKVWAWKKKRAKILGENVSVIATIFPFEPPIYKNFPAKTVYVGNPSAESYKHNSSNEKNNKQKLALVPGSRVQEITRILPIMVETVKILKKQNPKLQIKMSVCRGIDNKLYEKYANIDFIEFFNGSLKELLAWSDLALVTSGTATLESALAEVPFVLVYKTSPITFAIAMKILKNKFFGLPNIIADKEVVPERMQNDATPTTLANDLMRFINDDEYYNNTIKEFKKIKNVLGAKKPSQEVSRLILETIR